MGQGMVIHSKVSGVTFTNEDGSNRQQVIRKHCRPGTPLLYAREPSNPRDRNAIGLWVADRRGGPGRGHQVGYIGSQLSTELAYHVDRGGTLAIEVLEVTGGTAGKEFLGVNIAIRIQDAPRLTVAPQAEVIPWFERLERLGDLFYVARRRITAAIVGGYQALPEWAQPIVWGLGIGGAVLALVVIYRLLR